MKRTLKPAPHTPGPWKVYQEKPHYYSVGTDYAHDRGHDSNIVRDVRCEANARIMASAPELLAVLEQCEEVLRTSRLHADIQAAIAKAKGAL